MKRRRFLATSATVTAIGLAGCGGPDDEDGGDDDGGGYALTEPASGEAPAHAATTR
ncbi:MULTISPECIES: hypothetical protein [Natrialbaceae]|uniref:hypothetical protein n=1 Tax=Natrialbaceae TaxID=1644061 RepID=UPI00207D1862|nr:hypothetical protein [Natronococcus sp. CG52]